MLQQVLPDAEGVLCCLSGAIAEGMRDDQSGTRLESGMGLESAIGAGIKKRKTVAISICHESECDATERAR